MKRVINFLLMVLLLSLTSCNILPIFNYKEYSGKYTDLYTVAVNSVFTSRGFYANGEVDLDPNILMFESDNYGRNLFFYSEGYSLELIVMQASKDNYVYFLNNNYISNSTFEFNSNTWSSNDLKNFFLTSDIDKLKQDNLWNQPLNLNECIQKPISKNKEINYYNVNKKLAKQNIDNYLFDDKTTTKYYTILYITSNEQNLRLYNYTLNISNDLEYVYAVITNSNDEYLKSTRIIDKYDCTEIINSLKNEVGWFNV